jgi:type IV pilus assembly protein PilM
MNFLSRSEPLPIAVDLGTHSLKLLQLQERGGRLSVLGWAQQSSPVLTPGADRIGESIASLREMMRGGTFRGSAVTVVLPRECVQVKTLRLPILPEQELQAAIDLESHRIFTKPAQELTVRFVIAGEVKQGAEPRLETIVLAVEKKLIDTMLERFNQAGLYVAAFDYEPCSIYRGISRFVRRKSDEQEVNVLVDIGARQSQVVIGRGQDITFVKMIDIGGDKLSECVARKLGLSLSEACNLRRRLAATDEENDPVYQTVADATRTAMEELAHEVALCLRYYSVTFRGQRPARVRLLGGEANDRALCNALSSSLIVPVEVYQPLAGVTHDLPIPDNQPLCEWGVAFGASLRCLKSTVARDPAGVGFGRRQNDASLVEVVDLGSAVHSVTAEPLAKAKEAAGA